MGVRAERRKAREAEILDAAQAIVAAEGPDGLTMHKLAERVDAAVGALYRYFRSKDELIVALQARAIVALAEDLDRALDEADIAHATAEGALAALRRIPAWWRRHAEQDPDGHRFIDAYFSDERRLLSDEDASAIDKLIEPMLVRVGKLFHVAAEGGALSPGDPAVRTHVLWAALHGMDHFKKRDGRNPPALQSGALLDEIVKTLLVGWGASAEALS